MANIGLRGNVYQRIISGCRVPFDPRTTEEVQATRDDKNYKQAEKLVRKEMWQERQREKRSETA